MAPTVSLTRLESWAVVNSSVLKWESKSSQLWNKPIQLYCVLIHVSLFPQEFKFCANWKKFVRNSFLSNRTTFLLNINIKNLEKLLKYFYKNFSISIFFSFNAWHETKFSNTFLRLNVYFLTKVWSYLQATLLNNIKNAFFDG